MERQKMSEDEGKKKYIVFARIECKSTAEADTIMNKINLIPEVNTLLIAQELKIEKND